MRKPKSSAIIMSNQKENQKANIEKSRTPLVLIIRFFESKTIGWAKKLTRFIGTQMRAVALDSFVEDNNKTKKFAKINDTHLISR